MVPLTIMIIGSDIFETAPLWTCEPSILSQLTSCLQKSKDIAGFNVCPACAKVQSSRITSTRDKWVHSHLSVNIYQPLDVQPWPVPMDWPLQTKTIVKIMLLGSEALVAALLDSTCHWRGHSRHLRRYSIYLDEGPGVHFYVKVCFCSYKFALWVPGNPWGEVFQETFLSSTEEVHVQTKMILACLKQYHKAKP